MCTALDFNAENHYFGRTLDLEYHYNEEVVITPRNYPFHLKNEGIIQTEFAIIGMASVVNNYPLYYEAANEKGLAIAGLYFNGNAKYFAPQKNKLNLPTYEIIPYFLGQFKNIREIRPFLKKLNISNDNFSQDMPLSPLHLMISDAEDCLVLEQTSDGLHIYENPLGVMTNNPTFPYHLDYIDKFKNLTPAYKRIQENLDGVSFDGVGYGSLGLPGDFSPISRFVKTAFLREHALKESTEEKNLTQFFHILAAVNMIRGSVLTKEEDYDMTVYTSCINTTKGIYYYKTYENSRICAVRMNAQNKNNHQLTKFKLRNKQSIDWQN